VAYKEKLYANLLKEMFRSKTGKYYCGLILLAACLTACCFFSFWLAGTASPLIFFNKSLLGILIGGLSILFLPSVKYRTVFFIYLLIVLTIIGLLESRAGLLVYFTGLLILLLFYNRNKKIIVIAFLGSLVLLAPLLFLIKKDSTQGRWFIWKNCFSIVKNNWLTGTGYGSFRVVYNNQQANWFQHYGFQDKEAMLADTVYYAMNEWLHLAVEIGIPLSSFIFALIFFVWIKSFQKIYHSKSKGMHKKVVAAFGALLLGTFFSYPFYYLPTLGLFVFLFVWLIAIAEFKVINNIIPSVKFSGSFFVITGITIFLLFQVYARLHWKGAVELNKVGYKKLSLLKMKKAYSTLRCNGDYLFSLASIYSSVNNKDSAIFFCLQSAKTKNDYELNRKLGMLYNEMGKRELAAAHLLKAVYMAPNRLRSRELLIDFYIQNGDVEKARNWAEQTIFFPEKVPSETTKRIKEKLQRFLSTAK
jgi:O-antigen polymerase